MIEKNQIDSVFAGELVSTDGQKLGKVKEVYVSDVDGNPEWALVSTGWLTKDTFVPLSNARLAGREAISVPYDQDQIRNAPSIDDSDRHLSEDDAALLYDYYGLRQDDRRAGTDRSDAGDDAARATDDAMTRSEEHLNVGTQTRESGRARLRKYVTTETETHEVPVSHEEVRIEREPITAENAGDAFDGPAISEEEHEVVLHEERPVVEKEAVPVERVRLGVETVQETATVSDEVRKEHIETGDGTELTDGDASR